MSFIFRLVRRLPVLSVCVAALVICAGAYAALSATEQARPETEPAPTGQVPPIPDSDDASAREVASRAAAEAGQGVAPSSVRRLVGPSAETLGYSLWGWRADDGHPATMIIDPDGTPVVWTGCRQQFEVADRCGGYATPEGVLVLSGRADPSVRSVEVAGRQLDASAARLGDGGWLWVRTGFTIDTPDSRAPDVVIARTADGTDHSRPVAP